MIQLVIDGKYKKENAPIHNIPVVATVESFGGKRQQVILKRVDEDDTEWRFVEDNAELDEWNWTVIGYEYLSDVEDRKKFEKW